MATTNLHTTQEWEAHKPAVVVFEHFIYKKKLVIRVTGYVNCKKKPPHTSKFVEVKLPCSWNENGQCFQNGNKRKRDYDIRFDHDSNTEELH